MKSKPDADLVRFKIKLMLSKSQTLFLQVKKQTKLFRGKN